MIINIYFFRKRCLSALFLLLALNSFSQTADFKVQHLQNDVPRVGTTNTTFTAVSSLNNAVELPNNNRKTHAGRSDLNTNKLDGDDLAGARQLTGTGTLSYFRESGSIDVSMKFSTSIWEYVGSLGGTNEMKVRGRFAVSLNGSFNSVIQAVTGVSNANKCIPFITGIMNNVASEGADSGTAIAYLENSTTLRVQKGSNANNVIVYITLVEFTGSNWTVLHGDSGNVSGPESSLTLRDGSDGTGTAKNVSDWSQAIIFSHHRGDTDTNGINDRMSSNWPLMDPGGNNQTVHWKFGNGYASDGTNRQFVHVLNNSFLKVSRYQNTSNIAGETTLAITAVPDVNKALIIGSSQSSGFDQNYGRGWRNYYFNSTTQVAHWAHRNGNTMAHELQIVDLSDLKSGGPIIPQEINVLGNGANILSGTTVTSPLNYTDFGIVKTSSGSIKRSFTIQNLGTANLVLSTSGISGLNSGDFSISIAPVSPVTALGYTTFEITFDPSADGLKTATISIASNDTSESIYTFNIQGYGGDYCISSGNGVGVIRRVLFNGIDNDTPGTEVGGYYDYTTVSTPLVRETRHQITVNVNTGGDAKYIVWVWFDWNQDGDFNDEEEAHYLGFSKNTAFGPVQIDPLFPILNYIAVPSFAKLGKTRMRVTSKKDVDPNSCESIFIGQTEDYSVVIKDSYCTDPPTFTGSLNQFISKVQLGSIDNTSLASLSGYADFTTSKTDLKVGTAYPISISSGGTANPAYYYVWIDLNHDDDFNDLGELVFYSLNNTNNPVTGSFTLPTQNRSGITRLRVYMSNAAVANACDNFAIGEVEDYSVNILPIDGPGGVNGSIQLWLKANEGSSTAIDGSDVNSWVDQSGVRNNTATTGNLVPPIYKDNTTDNINFNPVLAFGDHETANPILGRGLDFGDDFIYASAADGGMTWFTVVQPKASVSTKTRQYVFDFGEATTDGYGFFCGNTKKGMYTPSNISGDSNSETDNSYGSKPLLNRIGFNFGATLQELHSNGLSIADVSFNNVTTPSLTVIDINESPTPSARTGAFTIGHQSKNFRTDYENGRYLNGSISEIIGFNRVLAVGEIQKIESYLAIKYGFTLNPDGSGAGSSNYFDSAGNIIWSVSDNTPFNYNITGIGRDDISKLNQKQSKSIYSSGLGDVNDDITIGLTNIYNTNIKNITDNPNSFNNYNFLVWGHNNGSLAAGTKIEIDLSAGILPLNSLETKVEYIPVQRIWKVMEVGTVGTTKISISKSMLANTVPALDPGDGFYFIIMDDSAVFDSSSPSLIMKLVGNNLEVEYNFGEFNPTYITFGYTPKKELVRSVYFDGTNDYVAMGNVLNLNASEFTVSTWIKREAGSEGKSILSKRNSANTDGYDFRINASGYLLMVWRNGSTTNIQLQISTVIPLNEWHNVAAIYKSGTLYLYLDGVLGNSGVRTAPQNNNEPFYIGAVNGTIAPANYFKGNIDEVRIWDKALSENELRFIINQEIENNATLVSGKVIPSTITKNEVKNIPWGKLAGYYPMSTYAYPNLLVDASQYGNNGALTNLNTVDYQTAPLPYVSILNTDWDLKTTWNANSYQSIPGSVSLLNANQTIDWNIVKIDSNVTMDNTSLPVVNNSVRNTLGLFVNTNKKLTLNGITGIDGTGTGFGVSVSHYLDLDGVLDLSGESQLIQTMGCDLDENSTGFLERDQQGTANSFNYNYWTSSVGPIGEPNNTSFQIGSILFNGTNPNSPTVPVYDPSPFAADSGSGVISSYWLYQFYGLDDDYNSWFPRISETAPLSPGVGYTMKGSLGATTIGTDLQNYVFRGKPFNGDILLELTNSDGIERNRLIGNPYSSALDANLFIKDNLSIANGGTNTNGNIFNGALYFWDHFGEKDTHILKEYVGGYATRNLITGVRAQSTDSRINNDNSWGSKISGQYIPVSQAFFVITDVDIPLNGITTVTGGNIVFKNSQRLFAKEYSENSPRNSVFMKTKNTKKVTTQIEEDLQDTSKPIIRLLFESPLGYHREIALGAVECTTNNFDIGYDALLADIGPEDMFWTIQGAKFVIQGVPNFDQDKELPLGIIVSKTGLVRIKIDALENVNSKIEIYIKDAILGTTTKINNQPFEITLIPGTYKDRFSLTFKSQNNLSVEEGILENGIEVFMNQSASEIQIKNNIEAKITKVNLYNSLGQLLNSWKSNFEAVTINLPVYEVMGVYIVQIKTSAGTFSKKVIIK